MYTTKKRPSLFLQKYNEVKTKKQGYVKKTLLDNVTIGKEIGKGKYGTVYLATDTKGNNYAYKIEKLLPEAVPNSLISSHWRELDFAKSMSKYPDQFIKLYDSRIEYNCKHVHVYKERSVIGELEKRFEKSPYCSIKLWSLIDGTMDIILKKRIIERQLLYDIYIQLVNINYLIWKEGYKHSDLHFENVGYVLTNKQMINILGHKIPTHGYMFKAIDFGSVLHPKYPIWQPYNELTNDLVRTLSIFSINLYKGFKYTTIQLNGKPWNWYNEWNINRIAITKDELVDLEKYLPTQLIGIKHGFKSIINEMLFKLIYYEKWQRRVLNDESIVGVKPDYLMPLDTILYIIKHIYEPKQVLIYLIKNRNKVIKIHSQKK
jgi:hypothetical protein